ncbi:flagellar basal-body rod protein FlgF [Arenibaculum pallidiluteum]|uniref:flagellar basal-body rod protein FlgF n=1 Tax=Arenibaculum pallidiluteum TaxID=2812559 RepID=UPI001A9749E1|nr:flagellar basal-body rod protein FlgF [Arenibaculum pallidiluteum]
MENPLYIALSRQNALRRQLDVTAHNVANMNTTGYKNQRMLFVEYIAKPQGVGVQPRDQRMSMVEDLAVLRDLSAGPIAQTGNPFDLALDGDGYLVVETTSGPRYTRTGQMHLDGGRRIVNANGLPLLGEGNQPIELPADAGAVTIRGDGTIETANGGIAGRLQVVRFERPQFMSELGGGLYASDEPAQPAEDTRVLQGALEQSNVQAVAEMTQMTEILRQYQSTQRLIETEHERQRSAIQRLARTN